MVKLSESLGENGNNIKKIIKGSLISIVITTIGLLVFASLLSYTSISETTIPTVTIINSNHICKYFAAYLLIIVLFIKISK